MHILITGGAGFVGSSIAIALTERHEVTALDNLHRRGSELNLPRLREADVNFVHGDVRILSDLLEPGQIDAIVDCSAESSVMAGVNNFPAYPVETNIIGAYNCLELARINEAQLVFLSTSRVYPIDKLESLLWLDDETRFTLVGHPEIPGVSSHGIAEEFPLQGARSLYGATKLSAELLIAEYNELYGLRSVINRCGVIAGPWQMGVADQGIFTYWLLSHMLDRPLSYIGYGGLGKQVRDILHIKDLVRLIDLQLTDPDHWNGRTFNVGGGRPISLSLLEATYLCQELTGKRVSIEPINETRSGDVRIYLTDFERLRRHTTWRPEHDARMILEDILSWIWDNKQELASAF